VRAVALLVGLGLAAGCGRTEGGLQVATPPDMAKRAIADLAQPDLAQANCGQIVSCAITQAVSNPLGAAQCFQGASAMGQQEAGALFLCAVQHCLAPGDGGVGLGGGGGLGGGNQLQLLQCLGMSCQAQLTACQGLPF
jgi:hypothetical protein